MDPILSTFAEFASAVGYRDLPPNAVQAAKERMLDALGCALGAYDCDTAEVGRSLAGPAARNDLAGRIIGSNDLVSADDAAFINSCMIRNLDFNDTYPGGHPSDALGAHFAVAPQIGASGERLIAAAVVAYEIFIRIQMKAQLREKGWDQGFGISVGAAAGLCNLMGLSRDVAKHAIAITAVANMPMRASRAGQLSMWKGAATAYAVRNAVFGVQLAAAGMTGPEAPFTGRHGLTDLITGPIELPPFGKSPEDFFIPRAKIKYWPVVYNMQALVWCAIGCAGKSRSSRSNRSTLKRTGPPGMKAAANRPNGIRPRARPRTTACLIYSHGRSGMGSSITTPSSRRRIRILRSGRS